MPVANSSAIDSSDVRLAAAVRSKSNGQARSADDADQHRNDDAATAASSGGFADSTTDSRRIGASAIAQDAGYYVFRITVRSDWSSDDSANAAVICKNRLRGVYRAAIAIANHVNAALTGSTTTFAIGHN
ncbi:MAG: hypothetical protein ACKOOL_13840 [Novosphingobium sp.]